MRRLPGDHARVVRLRRGRLCDERVVALERHRGRLRRLLAGRDDGERHQRERRIVVIEDRVEPLSDRFGRDRGYEPSQHGRNVRVERCHVTALEIRRIRIGIRRLILRYELDGAVVELVRIVVEAHVRQELPVGRALALPSLPGVRERRAVPRRRYERHAAIPVGRRGDPVVARVGIGYAMRPQLGVVHGIRDRQPRRREGRHYLAGVSQDAERRVERSIVAARE